MSQILKRKEYTSSHSIRTKAHQGSPLKEAAKWQKGVYWVTDVFIISMVAMVHGCTHINTYQP
jgi:hypothetical protein